MPPPRRTRPCRPFFEIFRWDEGHALVNDWICGDNGYLVRFVSLLLNAYISRDDIRFIVMIGSNSGRQIRESKDPTMNERIN